MKKPKWTYEELETALRESEQEVIRLRKENLQLRNKNTRYEREFVEKCTTDHYHQQALASA